MTTDIQNDTRKELQASRTVLMHQLRTLDLAEAQQDIPILEELKLIFESAEGQAFVSRIVETAGNLLNPQRKARVLEFIQAYTATAQSIANFKEGAINLLANQSQS